LHEVEARLTDEQWVDYLRKIKYDGPKGAGPRNERGLLHAPAQAKITALAATLRHKEQLSSAIPEPLQASPAHPPDGGAQPKEIETPTDQIA
jgi:hypothetical protein